MMIPPGEKGAGSERNGSREAGAGPPSESRLLLPGFLCVLRCFGRAPGCCRGIVGANWATVSRPLGKHSSCPGTFSGTLEMKGILHFLHLSVSSLRSHYTACQNHVICCSMWLVPVPSLKARAKCVHVPARCQQPRKEGRKNRNPWSWLLPRKPHIVLTQFCQGCWLVIRLYSSKQGFKLFQPVRTKSCLLCSHWFTLYVEQQKHLLIPLEVIGDCSGCLVRTRTEVHRTRVKHWSKVNPWIRTHISYMSTHMCLYNPNLWPVADLVNRQS